MSIYKGTQLIAANGAPGLNGADGRDGVDGGGVILKNTCTEIHNMVNIDGTIQGGNNAPLGASWCIVEGFGSKVGQAGQGSQVRGMYCELSSGQGVQVEGNKVIVTNAGQGAHIEGRYNYVNIVSNGCHIEGMGHGYDGNPINVQHEGVHVEGFGHQGLPLVYSDGAHIGGYGITANTPMLSMPHQRGGYESGYIELIGLKYVSGGGNGEYARVMRNDGSMSIAGDLAFTAVNPSNGDPITTGLHSDGRYTLGEIVQALIDAGILVPPQ